MSDQNEESGAEPAAGREPLSAHKSSLDSNGFEERLAELAARYFASMKKSAEEHIAKAEVIVQIEEEFGKKYLAGFYAQIGEKADSSKLKKMRKIGAEAQRFKPHLHLLSDCWTTLYNLSILPKEKYLALARDGILAPTATWNALRAHCVEAKPQQPKIVRPPRNARLSGRSGDQASETRQDDD